MPVMRSGTLVTRTTGVPSLKDIAHGLGQLPRFVGQLPGSQRWTVLDHSIYLARLVDDPGLKLALLLHDAHECLTGDIPTDMKTESTRALQRELDERIMEMYYPGRYEEFQLEEPLVRTWDHRALAAEAEYFKVDFFRPERRLLTFGVPVEEDLDVLELVYSSFRRRPGDYCREVNRLRNLLGD